MSNRNQLPIALRTAYLALHRRTNAQLAAHSVTADQFVLLVTLARGRALTQRELAKRMPSDPSTVRAMLVLLEKQGFIQRDTHPTDARARTVALTAAGKRKLRKLWAASNAIRSRMFEALSPDEGKTLIRLLTRVTVSLNTKRAPACETFTFHTRGK